MKKSMIHFLVTIDTEEEREWGTAYEDHTHYTVNNIAFLKPLQEVFDKYGVKATYLIDYPVAIDAQAAAILKNFQDNHQAEIGMHLHPWVNPPYEEERSVANSFPANLPPELQYKKMKLLTDVISDAAGQRPVTYRAGRYGFNESSVNVLEELGYLVDTSVVPFREGKQAFEPTFGWLPNAEPYFLNPDNIKEAGNSKLLEVPLTVGFSKRVPRLLAKHYTGLPNIGLRRILKKAFDVDLYWLRPSYANLRQMIQLSETQIAAGATYLNMMFHSNELMPGGSKYNTTQEDVERYLTRLDDYFSYLISAHKIKFLRLKDMYPG